MCSHKLDNVFSWNILSDVPETIANLRVRWITNMIGTRTVDFVSEKLKSNQLIAGSVLRKVFQIRRGTNDQNYVCWCDVFLSTGNQHVVEYV